MGTSRSWACTRAMFQCDRALMYMVSYGSKAQLWAYAVSDANNEGISMPQFELAVLQPHQGAWPHAWPYLRAGQYIWPYFGLGHMLGLFGGLGHPLACCRCISVARGLAAPDSGAESHARSEETAYDCPTVSYCPV